MATLDWPNLEGFRPAALSWGVVPSRSAWAAFLTGQRQQVTHQADRLRVSMTLPACTPLTAAKREAFLLALLRSGDWVRLYHFVRPAPNGTMRGTPTITSNASAGATSIAITTTAGATLLGGDLIGVGSQLMQIGYAGATANGGGAMTAPLMLPLRAALTAAQSVVWDRPTATFQLDVGSIDLEYSTRGALQGAVDLTFTEVF